MNLLNLRNRVYIFKSIITPLVERGYLKRTIPDRPKSRFQKYVTSEKEK